MLMLLYNEIVVLFCCGSNTTKSFDEVNHYLLPVVSLNLNCYLVAISLKRILALNRIIQILRK